MINYLVTAADNPLRSCLAGPGQSLASRIRVVPYEDLPARAPAAAGVYVFAATDRLARRARPRVLDFAEALRLTPDARVLNHPSRLLSRLDLLDLLWRMGRNEFRAFRAFGDLTRVHFPVFLRDERSHDGALSPLIRSSGELVTWIGRALLLGVRRADLIVIEFCETADADGIYRKYGAFVIGGRIVSRGLAFGRAWMLKQSDVPLSRAMVLEEAAAVRENPHRAQLAELCALAGVDYGRVDYAVRDGRLQVWEINSNPMIVSDARRKRAAAPPELSLIRAETKALFYRELADAFEALDSTGGTAAALPASQRHLWQTLLVPRLRRSRWRDHIRRALRPVAPVLVPLTTPVCARVGRLALGAARRPHQ